MREFNPYAAPRAALEDLEPSGKAEIHLADRGTRLGAVLLDGLITGVPAGLTGAGLGWLMFRHVQAPLSVAQSILATAVGLLVGGGFFLAINGVTLQRYGQTVGKRICKIKIIKPDGRVPSLVDSFLKRQMLITLIQQIPIGGPILVLVDVLMIFRKDHRCLHDDLAGTLVVKA